MGTVSNRYMQRAEIARIIHTEITQRCSSLLHDARVTYLNNVPLEEFEIPKELRTYGPEAESPQQVKQRLLDGEQLSTFGLSAMCFNSNGRSTDSWIPFEWMGDAQQSVEIERRRRVAVTLHTILAGGGGDLFQGGGF